MYGMNAVSGRCKLVITSYIGNLSLGYLDHSFGLGTGLGTFSDYTGMPLLALHSDKAGLVFEIEKWLDP